MSVIRYCTRNIYYGMSDYGFETDNQSTTLNNILLDSSLKTSEKLNALVDKLEVYSNSREFNNSSKIRMWYLIKTYFSEDDINDRNGIRLIGVLKDVCCNTMCITSGIIKIYRLLVKRYTIKESADVDSYNDLEESKRLECQRLFDAAAEVIKRRTANLPTYQRMTSNGNWKTTLDPTWIKAGYTSHRYAKVEPTATTIEELNEMKYGVELEGECSQDNFQKICDELSTTPFEGGFLLDKRNWVMPTGDGSLNGIRGVEWVFAPFAYNKGIIFWTKVEEILKKYNFVRKTEDGINAGLHVHIDAKPFDKIENLENLHNKVYDETDENKLLIYERPENQFCSWRKWKTACKDEQFVKIDKFNEFGEQYALVKRMFKIRRHDRYGLLNYEHVKLNVDSHYNTTNKIAKGTIEFRGWNAKVLIKKAIDYIKKILTEIGIVKEN